jgi:cytochrome c
LLARKIKLSAIATTIRARMPAEGGSGGATFRRMRFAVDYRVVLLIGASVIALSPGRSGAQEGDPTAGAVVFKKCATCHIVESDTNKVGPSLNGVLGRKAGTHPDFAYSASMKAAGDGGLVWDEATLRDYLHNPKVKVKGTKMAFVGLKDDQEITDLIAYLKQYSK